MLLILTMVIMLALSTMAGTSLIGALLERSRARASGHAVLALYAAEAGISSGMAWLSDPANIDNYPSEPGDLPNPRRIANAFTTNTGWQSWSLALGRTLPNGARYDVTVRFARERENLNAAAGDTDCCDVAPDVPYDEQTGFQDGDANDCTDCPGELVLYNVGSADGHFGFPDAYYSGSAGDEGFPLVEIRSRGVFGSAGVREIALYAARNHKAQIEGAFTSRASVTAGGSSVVDGRNHDSSGALGGSCGSDEPGITVDVGATAPPCGGNVVSGGSTPCSTNFDPTVPGKRPLATTPWEMLAMSEADFFSMFTKDTVSTTIPQACSASPYYLWFSNENGVNFNNSSGCQSYSGILVIHNEHFDAAAWERRCPVDWATNPDHDPAYCADPYYQPATFTMNGNVTWRGIVIADQVMLVNGTPVVTGGVYSLATDYDNPGVYTVRSQISGNITIRYSCEAIEQVTSPVGYKKKLGWRRLR